MKENHKKFTIKQEKFIIEYMIDGNGTRSAIAAGYSPLTAQMIAYENLLKPYIAEEIQKRKEIYAKKCEINKDEIVNDLKELIANCKNDGDRTHLVKAVDILNKMAGNYSTSVNLNVKAQPLFPDLD